MSHETPKTEKSYSVVMDGEGFIDPVILISNLDSFDSANHYAHGKFQNEMNCTVDLEPMGEYLDKESGLSVFVVRKNIPKAA